MVPGRIRGGGRAAEKPDRPADHPYGGPAALEEEPGYTPRAEKVLENSGQEAAHFGSRTVGTEHILIGMLRETDCVGTRLLFTMGVNIQKLYAGVLAAMGEEQGREELPGQRGRNPEAGTPTLDAYSRDLTEMARQGKLDPVVGREQEIDRIIQILSRRTKNNPCLIGEPGVGKTAIAEGLAQRIALGTGAGYGPGISGWWSWICPAWWPVPSTGGEFEERIKKVVREVMENQNILLFIDELQYHHRRRRRGGGSGRFQYPEAFPVPGRDPAHRRHHHRGVPEIY